MVKNALFFIMFIVITLALSGNMSYSPFWSSFTPEYDQFLNSFAEIMLAQTHLSNITVSNTGDGSFTSINTALNVIIDYCNSGLYNGEPIRIRVMPGTYAEDIDLSPLAAYLISSFTLEGIGEAIIEGGITLDCSAGSLMPEAEYFIKSLQITNTTRAVVFIDASSPSGEVYSSRCKLTIDNCNIHDCGITYYSEYSSYGAAGIHFEGAGVIKNSTFTNNVLTASSSYHATNVKAGAVYVLNNSDAIVEVTNNTFTDNRGSISGGIVLNGTGTIKVSQNIFEHNIVDDHCFADYREMLGNAISVFDACNTEILYNLFIDNTPTDGGGTVAYLENTNVDQPLQPIVFANNTIKNNLPINTAIVTSALTFKYQSSPPSTQDIITRNNIFSCSIVPSATSGARVTSVNGYSTPNLNNNVLYNTTPVGFAISNNPTQPRFNYTCDPQLDSNYAPIWDQTTMSPCIDAGIGDNDTDGTPPDIGAKQAIPHQFWDYSFTNQADLEKWYWVSYPVLNSRTNDMLQASEFFSELLPVHLDMYEQPVPTYLDEIDWMIPSGLQNILWYNGDWSPNQSSHYVSSPQGYKIKMLPGMRSVNLQESGFKTPSTLPFPIWGGPENWLGYVKEAPAWPHEAFASIWEDINMIKTKGWCLIRARTDGDYWGLSGKVYPLNYGDMVVVTTNNDHSFQWNNPNATPPEQKSLPEHFVFNEKQDYIPVYVTLPDSLMLNLKELGLYLDGVCKGAVVIENNIEQICAYLDIDEKLTDGVVEFVFYYNDNKSQHQESKTIRLDNSRFITQYVQGSNRYPFYEISISQKDLDNVLPSVFALNQNYPNPFNPSTTISYQLPESGSVKLEIYNLKGQRVKTLVNESQESGYHSVNWNGTDEKGRSVASGVYFYRLSSPAKTSSKRMLLMK